MLTSKVTEVLVVAASVLVVLIGSSVFGLAGAFLPLVIAFPVLLMHRPKRALCAYWVWVLFSPTIEFLLRSRMINLMEQIFALYLLAILLGDLVLRRRAVPGTRGVSLLLLLLSVWIGLSAFVNHVPTAPLLHYLSGYMKHFAILYVAIRYLEPGDAPTVFRIMMGSFAVQLVFNLAYVAGVNPLPDMIGRNFYDAFVGTLYSCHNVGYYMIACLLLFVAVVRHAHSLLARVAAVGAGLVAFVQFYFTFTIHGFGILALALATQVLLPTRQNQRLALRLTVALGVMALIVSSYINQGRIARVFEGVIETYRVDYKLERMAEGLKGQAYRDVFLKSEDILPHPWFGGGPGNYTSNTALIYLRPLAVRVMAYAIYGSDYDLRKAAGSILGAPRSGVLSIWGELGPIGYFLFWGLYVYAAVRIWTQYRAGLYDDIYRRCMAEAFPPLMVGYVALSFLIDVIPFPPLNLGLWIWAGFLWNTGAPAGQEQAVA